MHVMKKHIVPSDPRKHYISKDLVSPRTQVEVILAGCGGTGSQILTGMARMNYALKALGHPGIHMHVFDPDTVSHSNVGRQLFSPADVGQNKATLLTSRLNLFFGTQWESYEQPLSNPIGRNSNPFVPLIITAIDSAQGRIEINRALKNWRVYWLDSGNTVDTGQIILGTKDTFDQHRKKNTINYLPTVTQLYPELKKEGTKAYQGPSCSMSDALQKQDLFINQQIATSALNLLWTMFRKGVIDYHGVFIDLKRATTRPIAIDPLLWERMGFKKRKRKTEAEDMKKAA